MKLGLPNHPRRDLIQEIDWIGKNDLDFVDLFIEEDLAVPSRLDPLKIRQSLDSQGLDVVGHTAWYLPFGSPSRELRDTAVRLLGETLPFFSSVGVRTVTVHANWPPSLFLPREGIAFQAESLDKAVALAASHGLRLLYEPVDGPLDTYENTSAVLDRVDGLGLHVDIGHANLHGREPSDMIRRFGERIEHVHLHDNDGIRDLHLPPGCGSIDWKRTLAALKEFFDGTITIEAFSRDRDFILLGREKILNLWERV